MSGDLVDELKDQFSRQWGTLRESVQAIPEEQWKAGDITPLVPSRLLYHILGGAEVYARSCPYEEYVARRVFMLDWQTAAAAELPDRQAALGLLGQMERRVDAWLEELGDDGLLERDEGFPWTGSRKLGRAMYLLRHTQNHIGDMNAELRRRGVQRGKWR